MTAPHGIGEVPPIFQLPPAPASIAASSSSVNPKPVAALEAETPRRG
jgi:hypothetical protein